MLRIDPRERDGGPVSIQLFGEDPAFMREAAERVAEMARMRSTSTWAARCRRFARRALGRRCWQIRSARSSGARGRRGREPASGEKLPVTVKLRSGLRAGETSGFDLAHRLVEEAGVAAIAFHPRSAAVQHKGVPDYALAARLVESLGAP